MGLQAALAATLLAAAVAQLLVWCVLMRGEGVHLCIS